MKSSNTSTVPMSFMSRSKPWTESEEEYLVDSWGNVSIDSIAHHLKRSKTAVIIRARRLGLGAFRNNNDRGISKHQLFRSIGYSQSSGYMACSWVKNRGLPIHRIKCNESYWDMVYIDEFWEWAYKNQSFLDFSKFEKYALGPEPEWVAAKRSADYRKSIKFKKSPWTALEDEKLKKLLKEHKYGYKELSEILNRTDGAIQRRICDLGIKDRPIKADNRNKWSEAEYMGIYDCIKSLPAADVQEVRHGRWIAENKRIKSTMYICSACSKIAYDTPCGSAKHISKKQCKLRYCPHCGTKMDKE